MFLAAVLLQSLTLDGEVTTPCKEPQQLTLMQRLQDCPMVPRHDGDRSENVESEDTRIPPVVRVAPGLEGMAVNNSGSEKFAAEFPEPTPRQTRCNANVVDASKR